MEMLSSVLTCLFFASLAAVFAAVAVWQCGFDWGRPLWLIMSVVWLTTFGTRFMVV